MEINVVEIIYGCLQLNLWSKFPQNKQKLWKFTRNLLGRQVRVQLIDIWCSLSGHESRYFEEIFNPRKSAWGRISTFLMSGEHVYFVTKGECTKCTRIFEPTNLQDCCLYTHAVFKFKNFCLKFKIWHFLKVDIWNTKGSNLVMDQLSISREMVVLFKIFKSWHWK